jgi:hypothetical protein
MGVRAKSTMTIAGLGSKGKTVNDPVIQSHAGHRPLTPPMTTILSNNLIAQLACSLEL